MAVAEQLGHDVLREHVERFAVAKKLGDADQHVGQQGISFSRFLAQQVAVVLQRVQLAYLQAPFDTAQYRGLLVF